jgi:predicted RNA-binding Zn ribbon-like protein
VPLPDGSWPDHRGDSGSLDLVRRFCNTINREQGGEAWRSVEELNEWLVREGHHVGPASAQDLDDLLELRDAVWRSIVSGTRAPIAVVAEHLRFRPVAVDGMLQMVAEGPVADVVAGRVLTVVLETQTTGEWSRVKACQRCGWVFVDSSRNRSGRWCSMGACGGREKAKAYRARRAGVA